MKSGDHVVSSPVLYGGVYDYFKHELPRFGVEVTFVDFEDMDALKAAIRPNTKVVYTETISNPLMEVLNLPEIAKAAHAHGCKFIVDNTFATPAVAQPLKMGADIVVYSTTKYLGGHSDLIGGAILSDAENINEMHRYFTLYGAIMGPFEAWLLARSLRTLDLRMKQHSENALKVAQFLEKHPKVERVYYPGLDSSPYKALTKELFVEGAAAVCSAPILSTAKPVPAPSSKSAPPSSSYPAWRACPPLSPIPPRPPTERTAPRI